MKCYSSPSCAFLAIATICILIALLGVQYLPLTIPENVDNHANEANHLHHVLRREFKRKLYWVYGGDEGQRKVDGNLWLKYSGNEIPDDPTQKSDMADWLMWHDVCLRNGVYSRDYCLAPPVCDAGQKLCLNRAPISGNTDKWYVKVMKCVPTWENCDKCLCGKLKYPNFICQYGAGRPDDDRFQQVDSCEDYKEIELTDRIIKKFNLDSPLPATPDPTKQPSVKPTVPQTKKPTKKPSAAPFETPSKPAYNDPHVASTSHPTLALSSRSSKPPWTLAPTYNTKECELDIWAQNIFYRDEFTEYIFSTAALELLQQSGSNKYKSLLLDSNGKINNDILPAFDFLPYYATRSFIDYSCNFKDDSNEVMNNFCSNKLSPIPKIMRIPLSVHGDQKSAIVKDLCVNINQSWLFIMESIVPYFDDLLKKASSISFNPTKAPTKIPIMQSRPTHKPTSFKIPTVLSPRQSYDPTKEPITSPRPTRKVSKLLTMVPSSTPTKGLVFTSRIMDCPSKLSYQNVFYRDELSEYVFTVATEEILRQAGSKQYKSLLLDADRNIIVADLPSFGLLPYSVLEIFIDSACQYRQESDEIMNDFCATKDSTFDGVPRRMNIPFNKLGAQKKDEFVIKLCATIQDEWALIIDNTMEHYDSLLGELKVPKTISNQSILSDASDSKVSEEKLVKVFVAFTVRGIDTINTDIMIRDITKEMKRITKLELSHSGGVNLLKTALTVENAALPDLISVDIHDFDAVQCYPQSMSWISCYSVSSIITLNPGMEDAVRLKERVANAIKKDQINGAFFSYLDSLDDFPTSSSFAEITYSSEEDEESFVQENFMAFAFGFASIGIAVLAGSAICAYRRRGPSNENGTPSRVKNKNQPSIPETTPQTFQTENDTPVSTLTVQASKSGYGQDHRVCKNLQMDYSPETRQVLKSTLENEDNIRAPLTHSKMRELEMLVKQVRTMNRNEDIVGLTAKKTLTAEIDSTACITPGAAKGIDKKTSKFRKELRSGEHHDSVKTEVASKSANREADRKMLLKIRERARQIKSPIVGETAEDTEKRKLETAPVQKSSTSSTWNLHASSAQTLGKPSQLFLNKETTSKEEKCVQNQGGSGSSNNSNSLTSSTESTRNVFEFWGDASRPSKNFSAQNQDVLPKEVALTEENVSHKKATFTNDRLSIKSTSVGNSTRVKATWPEGRRESKESNTTESNPIDSNDIGKNTKRDIQANAVKNRRFFDPSKVDDDRPNFVEDLDQAEGTDEVKKVRNTHKPSIYQGGKRNATHVRELSSIFDKTNSFPAEVTSKKNATPAKVPVGAVDEKKSCFIKDVSISKSPEANKNIANNIISAKTCKFYSVQELKNGFDGMDRSKREEYLSDIDFELVFGISKEKYRDAPTWKQTALKKKAGLF